MPTRTLAILVAALLACTERVEEAPARCEIDVTVAAPLGPLHPGTSQGYSAELVDLVYSPVLSSQRHPQASARVVGERDGQVWLRMTPARFHDGSAVTAADVAASIEAQASPASFDVTVLSESELLVRVNEPDGVRRLGEIYVTRSPLATQEASYKPAPGSGPFRLKELSEHEALLEAWPHGPESAPSLPTLRVSAVSGMRAAWARAMLGQTDFLLEVPENLDGFLDQMPDWHLRPYAYRLTYFLKPSGRALRSGLARWIATRTAHLPVPPNATSCDGFDTVLCRLRSLGGAAPKAPTGTVDILVWNNEGIASDAALRLQHRLHQLGVEARLLSLPLHELLSRMREGSYDLAVLFTPGSSPAEVAALLRSFRDLEGVAAEETLADLVSPSVDTVALRDAWSRELPLIGWFIVQPRLAVRAPFQDLPVAISPLRSLIGWPLRAECAP